MSAKDLQRIEVLTEVFGGRRTVGSAAAVLGLSMRQTRRMLVRYGDGGGSALIHRARGRVSNKQLGPGVRQRVTHTAIFENKRLGHALALIKA